MKNDKWLSDIESIEKEPAGENQRPIRSIWVLLATICLVGAYSAMIIPALVGESPDQRSLGSSVLWSSVFFAVLWRHRSRNYAAGAAVGVPVGVLVFFLAAFIAGYLRASSGIS